MENRGKQMKREKLLERLHMNIPKEAVIPLIIDTDAKNEADDQYAIIHHLLSPSIDVKGIVAAHFEQKTGYEGGTMEKSYDEAVRLLKLADIEDVPALHGCEAPLKDRNDAPISEGVEFIIEEARKVSGKKLYIAVLGAMTDIASAINMAPDIAEKIIIIWNGGGPYPGGRPEFNLMQDPDAVRVILSSAAEVWQIHQDVYNVFEVTLSELSRRVRPCGEIGQYLYEQLIEENHVEFTPDFLLRTGENWTLGDNSTVAVLIMNRYRGNWEMRTAPIINDDLTYGCNPDGKLIRVYKELDARMTLEDLFSKLELIYKPHR